MTEDAAASSSPRDGRSVSADLYRIAYDQGLRTLDDQRDELNGVRSRAVQFMAFVGSATAFLVGAGLRAPDRDWLFYTAALMGTALVAGALVAVGGVLSPRRKFELTLNPGTLVEKWIDRQVPAPPTPADLLRALAERQQRMADANETQLMAIRRLYFASVVLGTCALLVWGVLVWARA